MRLIRDVQNAPRSSKRLWGEQTQGGRALIRPLSVWRSMDPILWVKWWHIHLIDCRHCVEFSRGVSVEASKRHDNKMSALNNSRYEGDSKGSLPDWDGASVIKWLIFFKCGLLDGVLLGIFWKNGEPPEEGRTITGANYASLLNKIRLNVPSWPKRIYTAPVPRFTLPHAPYSPDLTASDYLIFPYPKRWPAGRTFTSSDEDEVVTNAHFADLEKSRVFCQAANF